MKHRLTVAKASSMAAGELTLKCKTCDNSTPSDGEEYCRSCKAYWEAVRNGLFDDPYP